MTKKSFNIISIIISIIFTASIIYFICGIVSAKKNGPDKANLHFMQLVEKTNLAAANFEVDTYEFSSAFINGAGNFADYHSLKLTLDSNLIYSYPYKTSKTSDSSSFINFKQTVTTKKGQSLLIEASIYTVPPSLIFNFAKTSFIIILIATIAAISILLFVKTDENSSQNDILIIDEDEPFNSEISNSVIDEEISITEEPENQDEPVFTEEISTETEEPEVEEIDNVSIEEIKDDAFEVTSSLQSYETIHSEESLTSDLEENLIKAAGTEQDVSLIVLKVSDLDKTSDLSEKLIECLKSNIVSRGYIYDYEDNGWAIILKQAKLDDAILTAEVLLTSLIKAIRDAQSNNSVTIGISARTERMISGERLLTEASEAEKHAKEDPSSPIIAFRVNPEKYRNFILNN